MGRGGGVNGSDGNATGSKLCYWKKVLFVGEPFTLAERLHQMQATRIRYLRPKEAMRC